MNRQQRADASQEATSALTNFDYTSPERLSLPQAVVALFSQEPTAVLSFSSRLANSWARVRVEGAELAPLQGQIRLWDYSTGQVYFYSCADGAFIRVGPASEAKKLDEADDPFGEIRLPAAKADRVEQGRTRRRTTAELFPHDARLDFQAQRSSTKFRESAAVREVESCRGWFLTPDGTAGCLSVLANYITVTRSVRGREPSEQPKQRTLKLVEASVERWLKEPSVEGLDAGQLQQRRVAVVAARGWGFRWKDYYPNQGQPARGEAKRIFAGDVLAIAEEALDAIRACESKRKAEAEKKPPDFEQLTFF